MMVKRAARMVRALEQMELEVSVVRELARRVGRGFARVRADRRAAAQAAAEAAAEELREQKRLSKAQCLASYERALERDGDDFEYWSRIVFKMQIDGLISREEVGELFAERRARNDEQFELWCVDAFKAKAAGWPLPEASGPLRFDPEYVGGFNFYDVTGYEVRQQRYAQKLLAVWLKSGADQPASVAS